MNKHSVPNKTSIVNIPANIHVGKNIDRIFNALFQSDTPCTFNNDINCVKSLITIYEVTIKTINDSIEIKDAIITSTLSINLVKLENIDTVV